MHVNSVFSPCARVPSEGKKESVEFFLGEKKIYRQLRRSGKALFLEGLLRLLLSGGLAFSLLVLGGGLLVLLVLGDEIVHVALRLGELHLLHALAGVPVEEGLAAEHGGELLRDALEELLDGGRVANEGGGHLHALGRDVADRSLDVVRDPLDEVGAVLLVDEKHLLVDLLRGDLAAEHDRRGQVAAVARVAGSHHVLGIEHLLRQFGHRQHLEAGGLARDQRGVTDQEEVQARERDQVHSELAEVRVELAREAQAAGDAAHHRRDEVVEVAVARLGQFQGLEANLV